MSKTRAKVNRQIKRYDISKPKKDINIKGHYTKDDESFHDKNMTQ